MALNEAQPMLWSQKPAREQFALKEEKQAAILQEKSEPEGAVTLQLKPI